MDKYESFMLGAGKKGNGMTYEDRLKNLEKARAVRQANLAKKKKGGGNYTQDYIDTPQINYAGSPLDMYLLGDKEEMDKERRKRGEIKGGSECSYAKKLTALKVARKVKNAKKKNMCAYGITGEEEETEEEEDMEGGSMSYMKSGLHTGMDMPTEKQFKEGGRMKKMKMKKITPTLQMEEVNIPEAIKSLANLASKFGLVLNKK